MEMFRKMGLRQLLVTQVIKSTLVILLCIRCVSVGIITKKDMLKHIAEIEH